MWGVVFGSFYYHQILFQACGDAKSKPSFLSDKSLESSIKYIVRKFPVIDVKSVCLFDYRIILGSKIYSNTLFHSLHPSDKSKMIL